ncbi:GIY-YIG nuclease family protein [Solirhodobacter olei]|uniref:GIY-YIG nuclease family protein n=1 Tax=Solirhodobacter olei TaxID=2493082 RepID=UPI000FDB0DB9|nr:GIY-YIG nuclease family protein [Solirhodobacter olei]
MEKDARRAAVAAWKERAVDAGVYAFRAPDGACWVGAARSLGAAENRLRFVLRTGGPAPAELAAAWGGAGGEGFRFEVLERLDAELSPMARARVLKEAVSIWRDRLAARPL